MTQNNRLNCRLHLLWSALKDYYNITTVKNYGIDYDNLQIKIMPHFASRGAAVVAAITSSYCLRSRDGHTTFSTNQQT